MHVKRNTKTGVTKIAGLCGIVLPFVFFIFVELAIWQAPWFQWTQHALSDLGVSGSSAPLFSVGVIVTSILALVFSAGLVKMLSTKTGGYVLMISSVALFSIGVFPMSLGAVHYFVSATFFVSLLIGLLILGTTLNMNHFEEKMAKLAIIVSAISICSPIFLLFWKGVAFSETIVFFLAFLWCMLYGAGMISDSERAYH